MCQSTLPRDRSAAVHAVCRRFKPAARWALAIVPLVILVGLLLPQRPTSPIAQRDIVRIDAESFWYFPWGELRVHKGIDILAAWGTTEVAPVSGMVLAAGSSMDDYLRAIGRKP